MLDLEGILTERAEKVLYEVKNLLPDKEVLITEMTDVNDLKISDGALVSDDGKGRAKIYLDPLRADEHRLVHELMHIKLHRSGWPQIYSMIPDNFTRNLALNIDNLIDHYIFNPEIEAIGIDSTQYKENYCSIFDDWTRPKSKKLDILHNSFLICEGLLFGESYRTKSIESMEIKYSESLNLAFELEEIIISSKFDKKDIRKKAVLLLDFVNDWVQLENPEVPNLRRIIGISPLFTEIELNKRASKYVHFKSERMIINHNNHYLATFILKSDKTRFRTYVSTNDKEPPEIFDIRRLWQKENLNALLESENMIYGIL